MLFLPSLIPFSTHTFQVGAVEPEESLFSRSVSNLLSLISSLMVKKSVPDSLKMARDFFLSSLIPFSTHTFQVGAVEPEESLFSRSVSNLLSLIID